MAKKQGQPSDDPSSAPESGTVRDNTPPPADRGRSSEKDKRDGKGGDDPSTANEER